MTRPTLTVVLASVLTARVEGERRAGLLKVLRPDFRRSAKAGEHDGNVVPLPRVIPMPTRAPDDDDPDAA